MAQEGNATISNGSFVKELFSVGVYKRSQFFGFTADSPNWRGMSTANR